MRDFAYLASSATISDHDHVAEVGIAPAVCRREERSGVARDLVAWNVVGGADVWVSCFDLREEGSGDLGLAVGVVRGVLPLRGGVDTRRSE